ncbi:MAG: DUF4340 domain-containing protein [Planctomycetota bacterium]
MKFRTTFILFIIALILGSAILLLKKYVPTTDELGKKKNKIVDVQSKQITSFEIRQKDLIISGAKDQNTGWQLTAPLKTKADQPVVEAMLREFDYLTKKDTIPKTNPADYGFDQPRLVITVQTEGHKTVTADIGTDTPLGNGLYLQMAGDANVYVVDKGIFEMFNKTVFDLRDKKIFDVDLYEVNKFRLIYDGPAIELAKKDNDLSAQEAGWHLTEPFKEKSDQDKPRSFLLDLNNLAAESFVDDHALDLKKYGLDQPVLKISVSETKNEQTKTETFLFGHLLPEDPKKIYLTKEGSNTIVAVDSAIFDKLKLRANDFRSEKLFELEENNLTRIEIQENQQPLVHLKRENEVWKLAYPVDGSFDASSISEFIHRLNDFQINEFTAEDTFVSGGLERYGLVTPTLTLVLGFKQPSSEIKTNLGLPAGGGEIIYVGQSGKNRVVALKKDFYDFLKKGYLLFQNKNVLNINRDEIKTFSVEKISGEKFSARQEKPGNWLVLEPKEAKLEDVSLVYQFLDNICQLELLDFIAGPEANLSEFGLTEPFLKLTLEFGSGERMQTKTLLVGKGTPDGSRYAKLAEQPFVFLLNSSVVNSLQKDIIKK